MRQSHRLTANAQLMLSDAIGFARSTWSPTHRDPDPGGAKITDTPMPRLLGGPVSSHALKEIGINEQGPFFRSTLPMEKPMNRLAARYE